MFPWSLFPFSKDMKDQMNQMNPNEMDSYIQGMMKKMFPGGWDGMMNPNDMMSGAQSFMNPMGKQEQKSQRGQSSPSSNSISANVFESFEDIYIRFQVPSEEWMKQLKIFHTSNQAIIENIPEQGERQVITLPCLVKKKGAVAQYKDGILELKIPKSIDMQYTEIDVSDKY
ncbi:Hsp20/alpha crystallin family protein [Bacillus sp. CH30_1T]|jgi:HSP20 family molecular chaperone IbpA|uniref:Hsp20/alpha crystallin family protein n=1 Tax=Bacillaceae TaxID=186817 RepID=UPI0011EE0F3F|nr:Hsp20/alpha crystallin family protein [Bacillus sp. CH30_1T]KAA0562514.1 Hsp20/alpha crystallin family protein [Bacillus sp. CH30_1T]